MLDPSAGVHGQRDIAIANGKVAAIEASIPVEGAARRLDARGKLVLPGLIDLHAHVFGAHIDSACLARGTTTVVDGGSVGANGFHVFNDYVIEHSRLRVKVWLNISTIGLIDARVGELLNLLYVDVEAAVRVAQAHAGRIIGFKARLSDYVTGLDFKPALRLTREAADTARLPIMIHVGDTEEALPIALGFLKPRDVVTHSLTGRRHGILDDRGTVLSAVREARQAGVHFDAAHGRGHFGFEAARRALDQGFLVDTLSTDIGRASAADPTFHLPGIMSKLIALGASLEEVVPLVTSNAARYLGREDDLGTLRIGAVADVAILELLSGDFVLHDTEGQTMTAHQRLRPWQTVRQGQIVESAADS